MNGSDILYQYPIYPNPVKNILYIPKFYHGTKELYNALVNLEYSTELSEINISYLDKGLYFIKLTSNN